MPIAGLTEEYKVQDIQILKSKPNADKALELLKQVAHIVQPLMYKRALTCPLLTEFLPSRPNLMGLNVNGNGGRCSVIKLRLRRSLSDDSFVPLRSLLHTMVHELTHNHFRAHNAAFFERMDEMLRELQDFQDRGVAGTGQGFDARSAGRIGGRWRNPSPAEARLAAAKAAERRAQLFSSGGQRLGGQRLGGNEILTPREAAARAAERRAAEVASCGNDDASSDTDLPAAEEEQEARPDRSAAAPQQPGQRKRGASDSLLAAPRRKSAGLRQAAPLAAAEVIVLLSDSDDEAAGPSGGRIKEEEGRSSKRAACWAEQKLGEGAWDCAACEVPNPRSDSKCMLCSAVRP